jgi:hypothetical protein
LVGLVESWITNRCNSAFTAVAALELTAEDIVCRVLALTGSSAIKALPCFLDAV